MHRNTLVDILFETTQNKNVGAKIGFVQKQDKNNIRKQYQNVFQSRENNQKASKIIKITQFNSSLVIGDQKMLRNQPKASSSASPQKKFYIKKINDLKNKMVVNAQKIVEFQLKQFEKKSQFHLNKSFTHDNNKRHMENILVSTRFKKEPSNIDNFTSSIIMGEDFNMTDRNIEDSLNHLFLTHKRQIQQSKEMLSDQNQMAISHKNGSEKKVECMEFSCKLEDSCLPSRKYTGSPRKHYSKHIQEQKKYQQIIQQQKRQMLELKKQLNKNYCKPFTPPENISAFSYIIYEADAKRSKFLRKVSQRRDDSPDLQTRKALLNSHKVIVALNSRSSVEIASLTKIMTCVLTFDLAKKYNIKLNQQLVTIGFFEENIGGTSANIKKGQIFNVEQLIYGLMLPSGNDASLAIAVWGGKLLLQKQIQRKDILGSTACSNSENPLSSLKKKDCYQRFIVEMNNKAVELNMSKTRYANSHGLANFQNKSCTYDLALLCEYAMNKKQFRNVVSCKVYETIINIQAQLPPNPENQPKYSKVQNERPQNESQEGMQLEQMKDLNEINETYNDDEMAEDKNRKGLSNKAIRWQNTHQLLQNKSNLYVGIKTGITTTAGPCLASCIQINGRRYIIIVLNSKTMKSRFRDTQNLRKWLFNKQQIKYKEEQKNNEKNYLENQQYAVQCEN